MHHLAGVGPGGSRLSGSDPGKDYRKDGCAGSLLHNGTVTSHTSAIRRKPVITPQDRKRIDAGEMEKPEPQLHPRAHPAVQKVLDDIEHDSKAQGGHPGSGHGNCAEVSLISDRLHQLL
ncbi:YwqJ-related putative deaminase [Streptomyces sp. NPDC054786]